MFFNEDNFEISDASYSRENLKWNDIKWIYIQIGNSKNRHISLKSMVVK